MTSFGRDRTGKPYRLLNNMHLNDEQYQHSPIEKKTMKIQNQDIQKLSPAGKGIKLGAPITYDEARARQEGKKMVIEAPYYRDFLASNYGDATQQFNKKELKVQPKPYSWHQDQVMPGQAIS